MAPSLITVQNDRSYEPAGGTGGTGGTAQGRGLCRVGPQRLAEGTSTASSADQYLLLPKVPLRVPPVPPVPFAMRVTYCASSPC